VIRSLLLAARFVARDPSAGFPAALGFLARGGILLFFALVIEIPSAVTVTQIFGIDAITGTGEPTPRLVLTIVVAVGLVLVAVFAMIGVAAWTDAVVFSRIRGGGVAPAGRVAGLAWLQSLLMLPGLVGFVLLVPLLRDLVIGELLLPSHPEVPFVLRVVREAEEPLLRVVLVVAALELLVTVATRVYLGDPTRRSAARAYIGALAEIARRPAAAVVAWLVGWVTLLAGVAVGLAAVTFAWADVQAIFLAPDAFRSLSAVGRALGAATLFAAVWVLAILLIGLASAFRSALWTFSVGPRPALEGIGGGEFATSQ
jgi:hypothetical protein